MYLRKQAHCSHALVASSRVIRRAIWLPDCRANLIFSGLITHAIAGLFVLAHWSPDGMGLKNA